MLLPTSLNLSLTVANSDHGRQSTSSHWLLLRGPAPSPERRPGIAERDLAALRRVAPAQFIGAKMAMEMRLPVARKPLSESLGRETKKHLVVPGDTITTDTGFMRCVGTWGLGATKGGCWARHVARWPQPGPLSPVMKRPRDPERISRTSPLYKVLGCCSPHPVCPRVRLSQTLGALLSRPLLAMDLGSSA